MRNQRNSVEITTQGFGVRGKTWASLILGLLAAINFLAVSSYWPADARWPVHVGFVGYLLSSTLGFLLGAISEARGAKRNAKGQIRIVQESDQIEEGDKVVAFLDKYLNSEND